MNTNNGLLLSKGIPKKPKLRLSSSPERSPTKRIRQASPQRRPEKPALLSPSFAEDHLLFPQHILHAKRTFDDLLEIWKDDSKHATIQFVESKLEANMKTLLQHLPLFETATYVFASPDTNSQAPVGPGKDKSAFHGPLAQNSSNTHFLLSLLKYLAIRFLHGFTSAPVPLSSVVAAAFPTSPISPLSSNFQTASPPQSSQQPQTHDPRATDFASSSHQSPLPVSSCLLNMFYYTLRICSLAFTFSTFSSRPIAPAQREPSPSKLTERPRRALSDMSAQQQSQRKLGEEARSQFDDKMFVRTNDRQTGSPQTITPQPISNRAGSSPHQSKQTPLILLPPQVPQVSPPPFTAPVPFSDTLPTFASSAATLVLVTIASLLSSPSSSSATNISNSSFIDASPDPLYRGGIFPAFDIVLGTRASSAQSISSSSSRISPRRTQSMDDAEQVAVMSAGTSSFAMSQIKDIASKYLTFTSVDPKKDPPTSSLSSSPSSSSSSSSAASLPPPSVLSIPPERRTPPAPSASSSLSKHPFVESALIQCPNPLIPALPSIGLAASTFLLRCATYIAPDTALSLPVCFLPSSDNATSVNPTSSIPCPLIDLCATAVLSLFRHIPSWHLNHLPLLTSLYISTLAAASASVNAIHAIHASGSSSSSLVTTAMLYGGLLPTSLLSLLTPTRYHITSPLPPSLIHFLTNHRLLSHLIPSTSTPTPSLFSLSSFSSSTPHSTSVRTPIALNAHIAIMQLFLAASKLSINPRFSPFPLPFNLGASLPNSSRNDPSCNQPPLHPWLSPSHSPHLDPDTSPYPVLAHLFSTCVRLANDIPESSPSHPPLTSNDLQVATLFALRGLLSSLPPIMTYPDPITLIHESSRESWVDGSRLPNPTSSSPKQTSLSSLLATISRLPGSIDLSTRIGRASSTDDHNASGVPTVTFLNGTPHNLRTIFLSLLDVFRNLSHHVCLKWWAHIQQVALSIDGGCQRCGSTGAYPNTGGGDKGLPHIPDKTLYCMALGVHGSSNVSRSLVSSSTSSSSPFPSSGPHYHSSTPPHCRHSLEYIIMNSSYWLTDIPSTTLITLEAITKTCDMSWLTTLVTLSRSSIATLMGTLLDPDVAKSFANCGSFAHEAATALTRYLLQSHFGSPHTRSVINPPSDIITYPLHVSFAHLPLSLSTYVLARLWSCATQSYDRYAHANALLGQVASAVPLRSGESSLSSSDKYYVQYLALLTSITRQSIRFVYGTITPVLRSLTLPGLTINPQNSKADRYQLKPGWSLIRDPLTYSLLVTALCAIEPGRGLPDTGTTKWTMALEQPFLERDEVTSTTIPSSSEPPVGPSVDDRSNPPLNLYSYFLLVLTCHHFGIVQQASMANANQSSLLPLCFTIQSQPSSTSFPALRPLPALYHAHSFFFNPTCLIPTISTMIALLRHPSDHAFSPSSTSSSTACCLLDALRALPTFICESLSSSINSFPLLNPSTPSTSCPSSNSTSIPCWPSTPFVMSPLPTPIAVSVNDLASVALAYQEQQKQQQRQRGNDVILNVSELSPPSAIPLITPASLLFRNTPYTQMAPSLSSSSSTSSSPSRAPYSPNTALLVFAFKFLGFLKSSLKSPAPLPLSVLYSVALPLAHRFCLSPSPLLTKRGAYVLGILLGEFQQRIASLVLEHQVIVTAQDRVNSNNKSHSLGRHLIPLSSTYPICSLTGNWDRLWLHQLTSPQHSPLTPSTILETASQLLIQFHNYCYVIISLFIKYTPHPLDVTGLSSLLVPLQSHLPKLHPLQITLLTSCANRIRVLLMRLRPRTIALIVKAHIAYTSSLKTMPKMLALVTPDSRDPGTVVQSVYSIVVRNCALLLSLFMGFLGTGDIRLYPYALPLLDAIMKAAPEPLATSVRGLADSSTPLSPFDTHVISALQMPGDATEIDLTTELAKRNVPGLAPLASSPPAQDPFAAVAPSLGIELDRWQAAYTNEPLEVDIQFLGAFSSHGHRFVLIDPRRSMLNVVVKRSQHQNFNDHGRHIISRWVEETLTHMQIEARL